MELLEGLKTRRSVRKFRLEPVEGETLRKILEAGTYAPTGRNLQSPLMVVLQDPATIAQVSKLNAAVLGSDTDPFYGAPTVVVVLADRNRSTHVEDGSLVMGNLMLASHALGVGSCWIHRAKEVFESPEGRALLRKWGVPDDYVGVGNCILGYCDGDYPETRPRKEGYVVWAK